MEEQAFIELAKTLPITFQDQDFNSLDLEEGSVKDRTGERGKIKTGKLRDGRDVNVREKSSEGHPTLEIIQPNKTQIKIRYND